MVIYNPISKVLSNDLMKDCGEKMKGGRWGKMLPEAESTGREQQGSLCYTVNIPVCLNIFKVLKSINQRY